VETIGKVRRAYWVQGKKIRAIARELKLARDTVRRIVRGGKTELNILAHRAEPAAPAPVATPASLALTLPPRADCARYDDLRPPPPLTSAAAVDLTEAVHGAV
jgi:hypothetical protein